MSDNEVVLFERVSEHVALITLNRADKRNAVNGDVCRGVAAAVETVENDPQLRVAILAARGPVFCAGADLAAISAGGKSALTTETGGFAGFVKASRRKPWIAAVAGTAVGGGCELALACDLIVAGEGAQFGLPEVKRGLLAAAGGAFRIARALPRAIAIEVAITGRPLTAQQAHHFGLINRLVGGEQVVPEAIALAEEIAGNAPLSVQETLQLTRLSHELSEKELWELTDTLSRRVTESDDAKEGPRAFLEKRQPRWQGR